MRDFEGKVAVVTGAASGIGFAMCQRFAATGMRIALADLGGPALDAAAAQLREAGADVLAVPTDVAKWEEICALVEAVSDRFGGAHVVCNNAGVRSMGPSWETGIDIWRWVLGVDLWGVIHGVKAFVPFMIRHGEPGHIVNTASVAGLVSVRNNAPYAVSKYGVVALSEALKRELDAAGAPIGVSVLCPATVRTQLRENSNRLGPDTNSVTLLSAAPIPHEQSATEVAKKVLDAIENDKFWILTHPEVGALIRRRYEGIVDTGEVVTYN
jgi:NAD(P)-dependent dehydrogenase (short-subunit alcohol dehydrogenase family)